MKKSDEPNEREDFRAKAVELWTQRLGSLLKQEPLINDAAEKFTLARQIQEAEKRLGELGSSQVTRRLDAIAVSADKSAERLALEPIREAARGRVEKSDRSISLLHETKDAMGGFLGVLIAEGRISGAEQFSVWENECVNSTVHLDDAGSLGLDFYFHRLVWGTPELLFQFYPREEKGASAERWSQRCETLRSFEDDISGALVRCCRFVHKGRQSDINLPAWLLPEPMDLSEEIWVPSIVARKLVEITGAVGEVVPFREAQ